MNPDEFLLTTIEINALLRRHTHDIRNWLNVANLEAEALSSIDNADVVEGTQRIQEALSKAESLVRNLEVKIHGSTAESILSTDLAEHWIRHLAALPNGAAIPLEHGPLEGSVYIDLGAIQSVLTDLTSVVARMCPRGKSSARISSDGSHLEFTLSCCGQKDTKETQLRQEKEMAAALIRVARRNQGVLTFDYEDPNGLTASLKLPCEEA